MIVNASFLLMTVTPIGIGAECNLTARDTLIPSPNHKHVRWHYKVYGKAPVQPI
jgi:hypothetical protein